MKLTRKVLKKMIAEEYAAYKRILTGSPVTKSPLDLYKQCEFLKKELLGHTSYYTFRTRYAKMKTANFGGRSSSTVSSALNAYHIIMVTCFLNSD